MNGFIDHPSAPDYVHFFFSILSTVSVQNYNVALPLFKSLCLSSLCFRVSNILSRGPVPLKHFQIPVCVVTFMQFMISFPLCFNILSLFFWTYSSWCLLTLQTCPPQSTSPCWQSRLFFYSARWLLHRRTSFGGPWETTGTSPGELHSLPHNDTQNGTYKHS